MQKRPHHSVSDLSEELLKGANGNINFSNAGRTTIKEMTDSMNDPALLKLGSMSSPKSNMEKTPVPMSPG